MKRTFLLVPSTLVPLLAGLLSMQGCYTQFATMNRNQLLQVEPPDSVAAKQTKQIDTIRVKEKEVCYWDRDIWGYPVLECNDTYYPRSWYLNNYSPWWYRNDPYWFDYNRCPRYYYYDPGCGCCKYYRDNPDYFYYYHSGSSGGTSGGSTYRGPTDAEKRSRSYGVPQSSGSATSSGLPKNNTGSTQQTPASGISDSNSSPQSGESKRSRTYGVPDQSQISTGQSLMPTQPLRKSDETSTVAPIEQSKTNEAVPPSTTQSADSSSAIPNRRYRDPRGW